MPRIAIRPRAFDDLVEIWSYIAEVSPAAADRFIFLIEKKLRTIASHSGVGRIRPELGPNIRSFSLNKYIIFYFAMAGGIDVVRVLHGSRDIDNVFGAEE